MELFDKLGDTIVSVSKDATQKAKDISDLARIRMEICSKQDYLNKLFLEIGKIYYDAHKDDEEKEFKEQMLLIKDVQEVLEELNQQSGQIKGMVKCIACGKEMPMDADFCSKCGTKLVKPEPEKEEKEDVVFETEEAASEAHTENFADRQTEETVQSEAEVQAGHTAQNEAEGQTADDVCTQTEQGDTDSQAE